MEPAESSAPPAALRIGPVRVEPPVVLAPMAGYTDSAMRSVCREHGCGLVYTEMANAAGIVHGSGRTLHLLEATPGERPCAAHLYGSSPSVFARAAAIAAALGRFDLIDLNCGCPVRRIVARGAGSALMRSPAAVEAIVRAIRDAVALPVTVKTRIGLTPDAVLVSEIAHAAEAGGAAAIAVHARPASRGHGGDVDWELIARVKAERRIPVIGNGGLDTADEAVARLRAGGADAVMIGRAAVGNPWIFEQIRGLLCGQPVPPPTAEQRRDVVRTHLARLIRLKRKESGVRRCVLPPEEAAVMQFRGCLVRYLRGLPRAAEVRRRMGEVKTPDDVMAALDRAAGPRDSAAPT